MVNFVTERTITSRISINVHKIRTRGNSNPTKKAKQIAPTMSVISMLQVSYPNIQNTNQQHSPKIPNTAVMNIRSSIHPDSSTGSLS